MQPADEARLGLDKDEQVRRQPTCSAPRRRVAEAQLLEDRAGPAALCEPPANRTRLDRQGGGARDYMYRAPRVFKPMARG